MTIAKSQRRWLQYSLRMLLVSVVVFAIACSWLAVKMQQARRQREAVASLNGVYLRYDHNEGEARTCAPEFAGPAWLRSLLGDDFFATVTDAEMIDAENSDYCPNPELRWQSLKSLPYLTTLEIDSPQVTDAQLEHLEELPQLTSLRLCCPATIAGIKHLRALSHLQFLILDGVEMSDSGVEYLKGLTQLQSLYVVGAVTDDGLEQLKALTHLKYLVLRGSVTDLGLRHLENFPQLVSLCLSGARLNGSGLKHLKHLMQLQELNVGYTKITDAGLEPLKDLMQLRELDLSGTKVSDAGVKKLQQALPNCKIRH